MGNQGFITLVKQSETRVQSAIPASRRERKREGGRARLAARFLFVVVFICRTQVGKSPDWSDIFFFTAVPLALLETDRWRCAEQRLQVAITENRTGV